MNKLWRVICPIRQYNDKLEIKCNSYKKGHTSLSWYKTSNPDVVNDNEITSDTFIVNNLTEGEYVFFTHNNNETSIKTKVNILCETEEEYTNRLKQYLEEITQNHEDLLNNLLDELKANPSLRPFSVLVKMFKSINDYDVDKLKACFQLIAISEDYENMRSLYLNKGNEATTKITNNSIPTIDVGSMITKIIILKKNNDKLLHHKVINTMYDKHFDLIMHDNTEYQIEVYAKNNLVGIYVHFSGNDETKKILWENKNKNNTIVTNILEQLIELPPLFSFFNDEERKMILMEREKETKDELVPRPSVVINENGKINITIENSELLTTIGDKFRVVAKEPDRLFSNDYDRSEPIKNNKTIIFDQSKHLMFGNEYFYLYVQDSNKKIVSKLNILSLEDKDYSEYINNVRQLELYQYEKRLMQIIKYKIPDMFNHMQDIFGNIKNNEIINTANAYKYLLEQLNTNKYLHYFNQIVNTIMEDRVCNSIYSQKFFNNGIKFDNTLKKVIFPPKDDMYVLQIDKLNTNDDTIVTEYKESGIGALEILIRDYDYYILQAIDKNNYTRSGFIYISTTKYTPALNNWMIDIEVI